MIAVFFTIVMIWLTLRTILTAVLAYFEWADIRSLNAEISRLCGERSDVRETAAQMYDDHVRYRNYVESINPDLKDIDDPVREIHPFPL